MGKNMDVRLSNINKYYLIGSIPFLKRKAIHAVRDFSMSFEGGNLYALVGKNGSGKTTLLKLLAGILSYDSGVIKFDTKNGSTNRCSYICSNENIFYDSLTARQNIYFFSEIAGLSRHLIRPRLERYLQMFSMQRRTLRDD